MKYMDDFILQDEDFVKNLSIQEQTLYRQLIAKTFDYNIYVLNKKIQEFKNEIKHEIISMKDIQ